MASSPSLSRRFSRWQTRKRTFVLGGVVYNPSEKGGKTCVRGDTNPQDVKIAKLQDADYSTVDPGVVKNKNGVISSMRRKNDAENNSTQNTHSGDDNSQSSVVLNGDNKSATNAAVDNEFMEERSSLNQSDQASGKNDSQQNIVALTNISQNTDDSRHAPQTQFSSVKVQISADSLSQCATEAIHPSTCEIPENNVEEHMTSSPACSDKENSKEVTISRREGSQTRAQAENVSVCERWKNVETGRSVSTLDTKVGLSSTQKRMNISVSFEETRDNSSSTKRLSLRDRSLLTSAKTLSECRQYPASMLSNRLVKGSTLKRTKATAGVETLKSVTKSRSNSLSDNSLNKQQDLLSQSKTFKSRNGSKSSSSRNKVGKTKDKKTAREVKVETNSSKQNFPKSNYKKKNSSPGFSAPISSHSDLNKRSQVQNCYSKNLSKKKQNSVILSHSGKETKKKGRTKVAGTPSSSTSSIQAKGSMNSQRGKQKNMATTQKFNSSCKRNSSVRSLEAQDSESQRRGLRDRSSLTSPEILRLRRQYPVTFYFSSRKTTALNEDKSLKNSKIKAKHKKSLSDKDATKNAVSKTQGIQYKGRSHSLKQTVTKDSAGDDKIHDKTDSSSMLSKHPMKKQGKNNLSLPRHIRKSGAILSQRYQSPSPIMNPQESLTIIDNSWKQSQKPAVRQRRTADTHQQHKDINDTVITRQKQPRKRILLQELNQLNEVKKRKKLEKSSQDVMPPHKQDCVRAGSNETSLDVTLKAVEETENGLHESEDNSIAQRVTKKVSQRGKQAKKPKQRNVSSQRMETLEEQEECNDSYAKDEPGSQSNHEYARLSIWMKEFTSLMRSVNQRNGLL